MCIRDSRVPADDQAAGAGIAAGPACKPLGDELLGKLVKLGVSGGKRLLELVAHLAERAS